MAQTSNIEKGDYDNLIFMNMSWRKKLAKTVSIAIDVNFLWEKRKISIVVIVICDININYR